MVAALEAYVYGEAYELEDRETAGFVLYVAMARFRAGDAARITQEPSLDCGEQDDGYAESEAHRGKTIRGRKRLRLSLPSVAFSKGVLLPWAGTWLEVRKKLGLDAATDGALRMARGAGGHLVARVPATTTEIGSDIRRILRHCGNADLEGITSHSCKATLLSWAAKAGMKLEDRRLLGGHAKPGQKSPLEKSRDALAGPLERMRHVLGEIRTGSFRLDQQRARRWVHGHGLERRSDGDGVKARGEEEQESQGRASRSESSDSSSAGTSSSGSSSTVSSDESNADVEALAALEEIAPQDGQHQGPRGFRCYAQYSESRPAPHREGPG